MDSPKEEELRNEKRTLGHRQGAVPGWRWRAARRCAPNHAVPGRWLQGALRSHTQAQVSLPHSLCSSGSLCLQLSLPDSHLGWFPLLPISAQMSPLQRSLCKPTLQTPTPSSSIFSHLGGRFPFRFVLLPSQHLLQFVIVEFINLLFLFSQSL